MEKYPLDKKKRCPKGQIRNKEGVCVEKEVKAKEPKAKEPKAKAVKSQKGNKKASSNKTMKKLTKVQAAKILSERRTCIQSFRDKL